MVDEDSSLSDELMMHIKEMVELENGIDLETSEHTKLIMDEDELDSFFETPISNTTLFIPNYVLMKGQHEAKAADMGISIVRVPDYYFSFEMRGAGEL